MEKERVENCEERMNFGLAYDIIVRFVIQSMGEHRHDEHVDDERNEQSDGCLNEEIKVGITNLGWFTAIHIA